MLAARVAHFPAIQLLLNQRADVTLLDPGKNTVLHYAAQQNNQAVVELLLEEAPHLIDASNTKGETPLMLAAYAGRLSVVQWLLMQGANVNLQNNEGEISLHYAARGIGVHPRNPIFDFDIILKNKLKIMRALLAFGANFALKDIIIQVRVL